MLPTGRLIIPASGYNLKTDLVNLWEFDETSGAFAENSHSPNNYIGFFANPTAWETGKLGNCARMAYLDYNTGMISEGYLVTGFPFTISAWVNHDTLGWNGFCFDSHMDEFFDNQGGMQFRFTTGGTVYCYFFDATGASIAYVYAYEAGTTADTWYHIVVTSSGMNTGQTKLYKNGNLLTLSGYSYSSNSFVIGEMAFSGLNYNQGDIRVDQIGSWNKVLSQEEISYLYNGGNGRAYSTW